jgi:hypothetical protein
MQGVSLRRNNRKVKSKNGGKPLFLLFLCDPLRLKMGGLAPKESRELFFAAPI